MTACALCKSFQSLEHDACERASSGSQRRRVLLAEDDPGIVEDLKARLESLGYELCRATEDAEQTLVIVRSEQPDLVIMDIQLRGKMDGIQAAEQIRSLRVPVLYLSGYSDGTVLERAMLTNPCGYIVKPYTTPQLRVALEMAFCRHASEQEAIGLFNQFQAAMASTKTLIGRISICCYCKKVKDSADWSEIEAYVMRNSYATFTHGMCPVCFEQVKKRIEALDGTGGSNMMILG